MDRRKCNSEFYTPTISNEWFKPMNMKYKNITQISSTLSEYDFQLPVNCTGRILSLQVCLIIKNGTRDKIINFSSKRNNINITFNWKETWLDENCARNNEFYICCPILNISGVRYMKSRPFSIKLLQPINLTRLVCLNATIFSNTSEISSGRKHFPVLFRIRIGKKIIISLSLFVCRTQVQF